MKQSGSKKPVKTAKKSPKKSKNRLTSAVPLHLLKRQNFEIRNLDTNPEYEKGLQDGKDWNKRVLVFTPSTGTVRMEWVQARYGQIIPTNWSMVEMIQFVNPYVPMNYSLADAENLMAKIVVEQDYEWLISIEHDNILPPDAFVRFNQYINEQRVPVVSGLYFTKSSITEPILYRGRGSSHFNGWKLGDKVWVDGIPFGAALIHGSLIKELWKTSEEYKIGDVTTRRVFSQPRSMWFDEEKGGVVSTGGTTDLAWCSRLMNEGIFKKAGWPEFQKMKHPFLVDTNIFVKHILPSGQIFPIAIPARYIPEEKNYKGREIID